ncbi:MAG: peroxide stress protein YaaA [Pseudomonadota bacterium]
MIILLSPAKTLDFSAPADPKSATEPQFGNDAAKLIRVLKTQAPADVRRLMKLSEPLAQLNVDRYQAWRKSPDPAATREAILAFKGDVYQGLQADQFNKRDLNYAQRRIRILSGLYGILRPLDLMQPYRLEMGTRLENPGGKDLYAFWRQKLTRALNDDVASRSPKAFINLASNEYFSAIDSDALAAPVIAPRFLDYNRGDYRILSFFAKKARGAMASWLIRERVKRVADIAGFDLDGYRYCDQRSSNARPTFIRDKQ